MISSPDVLSYSQAIEDTFHLQQKKAKLWRSSTAEERIERIIKVKVWIKENQDEIRNALLADFNKPVPETDLSEIYPVTSEINHTIKNLKSWMKAKSVSTPWPMLGTKGKILSEPKGTSLIIAPWNYPFNLAVAPMISALAAGCTIILKPSEMTPHTSTLLQRMAEDLFDSSEVAIFQGKADVAQTLLSLPFDHIFFTGSPAVGKIVMKAASENLTSVTLELGGKSPAIVDNTADLKDAAGKLVSGKFINCGQTCVAPDYILVHHEQYAQLVMELKLAIQKMYDPNYKGIDKSPDLARIINEKNFLRITGYLTDAIKKGASLEFGGKTDLARRYFEPTILAKVTDEMEVMQEEIFGPLLPIMTYQNLDEAIEYINSKPKPLALYYFGNDSNSTNKVLAETSSGNAVINDCVLHFLHNELPFGGVNNSGIGKAHGHFGFLAFSNEKGILSQRIGLNNASLLKPPYGAQTKKIISSLIKWF
jgi:aldehyde dehydrogenase (NAD+)